MNLQDIKIMLVKGQKGDKGDGSYNDTEIRQMIADEALAREAEIAQLERDWLNYMYPVGSIYISDNSTSPQTLFGGIWEQIQGKFLLASSSSHTAGSTGGVESISYTPAGTVGNHTLTINEMPSHSHNVASAKAGTSANVASGSQFSIEEATVTSTAQGGGQPHNHGFSGTATTFDNMPPYLSVYVWKRTD